ncbi:MAG: methyltransferase domain-containing protein [Frankiaceae bacterium]|nr:methyltransferase domain-containing protein [Frankiaceae bacterium]MBV9870835.1 methyltransferase domain-containing protein [Frankiaceae bacterium]
MSDYVLDNAWEQERERLDALTGRYDEESLAFCKRTGLAAGWRCLELGPGTGRFAQALADEVGPTGLVLAVDIDTRLAEPAATANLEVRQLDIRTDPIPGGPFDLVHARLVIEHLPDRPAMLAKLADALRPGGWLVLEEFDNVTAYVCEPPSPVHAKVVDAVYATMRGAGFDDVYGRRLLHQLMAVGLTDLVVAGAVESIVTDVANGVPQWWLLVKQLEPPMLAAGLVTPEDLAAFDELLHDGTTTMYGPTLVRGRGRRVE